MAVSFALGSASASAASKAANSRAISMLLIGVDSDLTCERGGDGILVVAMFVLSICPSEIVIPSFSFVDSSISIVCFDVVGVVLVVVVFVVDVLATFGDVGSLVVVGVTGFEEVLVPLLFLRSED